MNYPGRLAKVQLEQAVSQAKEQERTRAIKEIEVQKRLIGQERDLLQTRILEEKRQAEREMAAEMVAKNKTIEDLEQEKAKIEQDLAQLKESNEVRLQKCIKLVSI